VTAQDWRRLQGFVRANKRVVDLFRQPGHPGWTHNRETLRERERHAYDRLPASMRVQLQRP